MRKEENPLNFLNKLFKLAHFLFRVVLWEGNYFGGMGGVIFIIFKYCGGVAVRSNFVPRNLNPNRSLGRVGIL